MNFSFFSRLIYTTGKLETWPIFTFFMFSLVNKKNQASSINTPTISYLAHIHQPYVPQACVSEFQESWHESSVECASEPECDEVSWSVSLGCLAGSERTVSPTGKAALLTSDLSRLTRTTCLFTFHREKRLIRGGVVNSSWRNTCRTVVDNSRLL